MDLNLFTTQQSANDIAALNGDKSNTKNFKDLGILFQNILQGYFNEDGTSVLQTTQISAQHADADAFSDLNLELERIINSLQLALSNTDGAANKENIIDLNKALKDLRGQITLIINSEQALKTTLDEETKLALLQFLNGTPLVGNQDDIDAAKSAFEDTEATLNEQMLFQKILHNLNQGAPATFPLEAIIAAGASPQDLQNISQKKTITISETTQINELSEDLIGLLGLVQNLPIQNQLQKIGLFSTLSDGGAWMLEGDVDTFNQTKFASPLSAEQLKNIIKAGEVTSVHAGSKAANMMAGVANENSANLTAPASFSSFFGGEMNWFDPASGEFINGPALPSALSGTNLTSLMTQAPNASAMHPAAHMVALSVQKQAQNSENRNWTLQLDPPDLGKVEIRLNFSKDKLTKIQMVIEKPETWLMLQRDAQALERALQDSGLETTGGDMSFELADQGHDFNQNGKHDGQGQQARGAGGEEEFETIETTMTWFVDPESGVQRYSLLA